MAGNVITLDGLPTKAVSSKRCGNLVTVHSSVTNEDFKVCESDLERFRTNGISGRRRRGRPRGTTVLSGAKPPRGGACEKVEKIKTKNGVRCRCTSPHRQFVKCDLYGRKK